MKFRRIVNIVGIVGNVICFLFYTANHNFPAACGWLVALSWSLTAYVDLGNYEK